MSSEDRDVGRSGAPTTSRTDQHATGTTGSASNNLRNLSSTLTNIRNVTEANKIIRVSASMIRCMMFFDLCSLITGISLLTVGLTNSSYNKERMIVLGGAFGIVASISATCNSLAAHGVRSWRRGFLVPWLLFYLVVLCMLVLVLAKSFYYQHLNLRQVFLFLICLMLYSCWRHLQKQFILMAYPKPAELVVSDVEAVVRELIIQRHDGVVGAEVTNPYVPAKDLPPKYEEVADFPPQYDAATMVPINTAATVAMPPLVDSGAVPNAVSSTSNVTAAGQSARTGAEPAGGVRN